MNLLNLLIIGWSTLILALAGGWFLLAHRQQRWHGESQQAWSSLTSALKTHGDINAELQRQLSVSIAQKKEMESQIQQHQQAWMDAFKRHEIDSLNHIQTQVNRAFNQVNETLATTMSQHQTQVGKQIQRLTTDTERHLTGISQRVNEQLTEGFAKTGELFQNVLNRLLLIDKAQEKIAELTHHVVDLQSVLNDKRSRGAFGEVQLNQLIYNAIPNSHYRMQATLTNGNRADCLLILPPPTGNLVIDAKFPLESFRALIEQQKTSEESRATLARQFKRDIKFHIDSIADKYIIPQETADGAMMFIPAEAIFAEIHANHADVVTYAQQRRVWLASPTTLMAVLTTASAVIRDVETRQHVQAIQKHLRVLGEDFKRFYKRLDNLSRHIAQAHQDVDQIKTSSAKIQRSFAHIDGLDLQGLEKGKDLTEELTETDDTLDTRAESDD